MEPVNQQKVTLDLVIDLKNKEDKLAGFYIASLSVIIILNLSSLIVLLMAR